MRESVKSVAKNYFFMIKNFELSKKYLRFKLLKIIAITGFCSV
ncbi:Uncharacterised protein [Flavobacterium hibernum]|nr:Uncharacterised protein [Flavobacterium hibernum]